MATKKTTKPRGYSAEDRDFLKSLGVNPAAKKVGYRKSSTTEGVNMVAKAVGKVTGAVAIVVNEGDAAALPKSVKRAVVAVEPQRLSTIVKAWASDNERQVVKLPGTSGFVVKPVNA